jgi:hypothetical protein
MGKCGYSSVKEFQKIELILTSGGRFLSGARTVGPGVDDER